MTNALAGRTFDAVLFDMDGTLIDSTPAVARSWITWAQEHDVEPRAAAGPPRGAGVADRRACSTSTAPTRGCRPRWPG
nr:HAD family hydrolase [Angustibacter aerolatus]